MGAMGRVVLDALGHDLQSKRVAQVDGIKPS
jgi:hypothetical protein